MKISDRVIRNLLIFDAHCDSAYRLLEKNSDFIDNNFHLDKNKIKLGGLKAQIFALYVNPLHSDNNPSNIALMLLDVLKKKIFSLGYGSKISNIKDMNVSLKNNDLSCWIFLEGGHIIENSIKKLRKFHSLGVKGITITHNKNTDWADSSSDETRWNGLNEKGIGFIKKIEELCMIVDVSHSSDETVNDILSVCSKPIMASHSNSRYICNIKRNLSDNIIKDIGENKGYIGVNFFPGFLNKKIFDQIMGNFDKYKIEHENMINENRNNIDLVRKLEYDFSLKLVEKNYLIDLNDVIDHIEHISDVGGIDVVGLGSDFDGIPSTPINLKDVSFYPNLVEGLMNRGFNFNEIKKIMGLNLYNFLKNSEN